MKPRRLELDFVVPPRRPRWIGWLVLAVSLFIAGDMLYRYREAQLALERLETARELLGAERRAPPALSGERLDEHWKNAEGVIRQLALPWAGLIETLERAAHRDVAVLQLQPEAERRVLRLTAEARREDAMLEYLRGLAAARGFEEVHLLSHQVREDDPQRPLQFTVQASFRGLR
jgi:Tfp pilus assembly protein PilN